MATGLTLPNFTHWAFKFSLKCSHSCVGNCVPFFCLAGAVQNTSALFTYDSDDLLETYYHADRHDSDFVPVFSVPENPDDNLANQTSKICTGEGSEFCRCCMRKTCFFASDIFGCWRVRVKMSAFVLRNSYFNICSSFSDQSLCILQVWYLSRTQSTDGMGNQRVFPESRFSHAGFKTRWVNLNSRNIPSDYHQPLRGFSQCCLLCVCVQWCPAGGSRRHRMEQRPEPPICRELECGSPARTASGCRGRKCACAWRTGRGPEWKPNAWFRVWINHKIILVRWLIDKFSMWLSAFELVCMCLICALLNQLSQIRSHDSLAIFFPNYIYLRENPKNAKSNASAHFKLEIYINIYNTFSSHGQG